ncbi:SPFH domain-containing protein [Natronoglycomyces albus]|uniref:SPFH domain-containing protein n=2 Tax=Natronoglycomyces albus TaxID=2811108 RepID=A0A895XNI4_9ACTN|nr:SPFH domain-containing protein [Natronoglycomyces albus]
MVWRFPRHNNEIKMGAKLVVRESQSAVFINEGQLADVFGPGTHTLQTQNMPILSTLKGWKHGFNSPFKAEVYFVNTRQFTDFKWGTKQPVTIRDPEFGAVRIRAFGAYAVRVIDPAKLLREMAGTDSQFRTDAINNFLREKIIGQFAPAIAKTGLSILDMAANQDELSKRLQGPISEMLGEYGFEVPSFVVSSISMPKEVEAALDKKTQMGIVGDMNQYTQFQAANALEQSAKNGGGGAADGMGMGVGMAMGQHMAQSMSAGQQQQQPPQQSSPPPAGGAAPPPLPTAEEWFAGINGAQQGPYDVNGLRQQISAGTLTRETLVWKNGMDGWKAAGEVPELANLFGSTPPPLPPQ